MEPGYVKDEFGNPNNLHITHFDVGWDTNIAPEPPEPVVVTVSIGGTASFDDYVLTVLGVEITSSTFELTLGDTQLGLRFAFVGDGLVEGTETLVVSIVDGDAYDVSGVNGTQQISVYDGTYLATLENVTPRSTHSTAKESCGCAIEALIEQSPDTVVVAFDAEIESSNFVGDTLTMEVVFKATTSSGLVTETKSLTKNFVYNTVSANPTIVHFVFSIPRSTFGDAKFVEYTSELNSYDYGPEDDYGPLHEHQLIGGPLSSSGAIRLFSKGVTISPVPKLEIGENGAMILSGSDGDYYGDDGMDGFESAPGSFSALTSLMGGGYELVDADQNAYEFDAAGFVLTKTDAKGRITTYNYVTILGKKLISSIVEPFLTTTITYDGNGKLTNASNTRGDWVSFAYTSGLLTTATRKDPDGVGPLPTLVTTYAYDSSDRMTSKTTPDGAVTTWTYDYTGNLASVETSGGEYLDYDSPALEAISSGDTYETVTDDFGSTKTWRDSMDNVTREIDAEGNETVYERDANGVLLKKILPDPDGTGPLAPSIYEYTYDSRGNKLTETLPDLSVRTWVYHSTWNQPIQYTDANGNITLYEYDATYELLLSKTSVIGEIDDLINLETDDLTTSYTYTPAPTLSTDAPMSLVASMTAPDGVLTEFEYDEIGNRTKTTYAVGTADEAYTSATYDSNGSMLTETDELGNTTTYTYDDLKRRISITTADPDGPGPLSATVTSYGYNSLGLLSTQSVNGRTTTYTYDSKGRLDTVTEEDPDDAGPLTSPETSYTYDSDGNALTVTDPLGNITTNTYTGGQLTSVSQPDPDDAGPLSAPVTSYTYDANGQILTITDPLSRVTTYEYDNLGRQISVTYPDPDGVGALVALSETTVYDLFGRVASHTDAAGVETTYTYDPEGNLLSETTPLGTTAYSYDELNRRVEVESADPDGAGPLSTLVTAYAYNAAGMLAAVTTPSGTTRYSYDNRRRQTGVTEVDPNELEPAIDFSSTTFEGYAGQDSAGGTTVLDAGATLQITGNHWKRIALPYEVTEDTVLEFDFQSTIQGEIQGIGFETDNSLSTGTIFNLYGTQTWGNETYKDYDSAAPSVKHYKLNVGEHFTGSFLYMVFANDDDASDAAVSIFSNVRVYEEVAPATTSTTYDDAGNVLSETDALGNVTSYAYDNLNRIVTVTAPDPDGAGAQTSPVTSYAYNAYGQMASMTDPNGGVTTYVYDDLGRKIQEILPDPDGAGALASPDVEYAYDAKGQLVSMTDELGNVTSYDYDNLGRRISITLPDPDGAGAATSPVTTYEYDAAGQLLSMTDPLGRTTTYTYDALGRTLTETLPDPDGAGSLAAPVTTYIYGIDGRLTSTTDAESQTVSHTYNSAGQVATMTDPRGTTTYVYDALGRQLSITEPDPDGAGPQAAPVTTYQYDDFGRMVAMTTNDGTTSYEYDALGRLSKLTQPDVSDSIPSIDFNAVAVTGHSGSQDTAGGVEILDDGATLKITGNHWKKIDLPYEVTANTVIEFNFQSTVEGEIQGIGLDDNNTLSNDNIFKLYGTQTWARNQYEDYDASAPGVKHYKISVGDFYTGEFLYLIFGNDDDVNDAAVSLFSNIRIYEESVTTYTYDAKGNQLTETNSAGATTSYDYDNLGRLILKTDAEGGETEYTYDANGNRLTLTDPEESTTTWTYDALNRMLTNTNELSDTRYYEYDAAGNLTEYTDRNGRVIDYVYDNLQRRIAENWMDGMSTFHTITYGYDAASQLVEASDSAVTYTFTYDNLGRNTSSEHDLATLGFDVVIDEAYDALGRRVSLAAEIDGTDDLENMYAYDYLNRMTQVTQAGQVGGNGVAEKRVNFAYDAEDKNQFTSITRFADVAGTELVATSHYGYDAADQLVSLSYIDGSFNTLAGYTWSYDAANRQTGLTVYGYSAENAAYSYDDTDQLTGADRSGTSADESYTYDENGNRIDGSKVIGAGNQILSDGTYNYTYDDEGNITRKTNIADGSYTVYEWDFRNRLASVTNYDVSDVKLQKVAYGYDAFNNLISRDLDSNGDGTVDQSGYFIYDNGQILLQIDDAGDVDQRLLWGSGVDQILADENAAGDVLWALTDQQNTIRDWVEYDAIADDTSVVNHIAYNAYGEFTSQSNSSLDTLDLYYTSRFFDEATGLQYNTNRWYDAELGRWISQDPIGFAAGDENLYRYVGNIPTNATDPSGLERITKTAVSKSYINTITNIGANGSAEKVRLLKAFAIATNNGGYIHDGNVSSPTSGTQRLRAQIEIAFDVDVNGISNLNVTSDSQGGQEAPFIYGSINLTQWKVQESPWLVKVGWFTWGRPDPKLEPSFQFIYPRTSVNIWHGVVLTITVGACLDSADINVEKFEGSDFPSHRLWVDSSLVGDLPQGKFSSLWQSDTILGPTFVTRQGTALRFPDGSGGGGGW
ncbi:hypothetical protein M4951_18415 [Blastopirellula sp. J2-11]|uniref:RHS repeat-associated core domain-containing protein n=1 Tax=Blastopirellula sp. J2-11 TaxID=2943192 RepID=UPI0021C906C2|nr:RHS repeat-associated core domain-containing protein [Blastopirellula sp. J2-11]UUO05343.1 hypothetical protein M4951_18415 [Blastopirellula sp. J2-11]